MEPAAPLTLFLPGAGADPSFWDPLGRRLPEAWPKSYLAWPGLGKNPHSPRVRGWMDLVELTESCLPETAVNLVAQSFGGSIALAVALRLPERVRRLVLATSAAGLDVSDFGASDWRPEYASEYPEAAPWIYTAQVGVEPHLPSIEVETLLLWGDADPISPLAVGEHLLRRLPKARLHVVKGGTHALGSEAAEELAPLVQQFLE